MAGQRVLVVDDDPTVSDVLRRYLVREGLEVRLAADGPSALTEFAGWHPDLVVLDLMLPGMLGIEVCQRMRAQRDVAIIMLTALGEESDRVLGLSTGADDYVTKPFSPRELALRVQSVLRRVRRAPDPGPRILRDAELVVDTSARVATLDGGHLNLTIREFDLLAFLMRHPGTVFRRSELLESVWGWKFGDQATVTVHVRRLREKVEPDPATPRRILTAWGVGYRYEPIGDGHG